MILAVLLYQCTFFKYLNLRNNKKFHIDMQLYQPEWKLENVKYSFYNVS